MNLFGGVAALHQPDPPGHISSAHRTGKDGARMNVAAHQEKNKNEKNESKRERHEKRENS